MKKNILISTSFSIFLVGLAIVGSPALAALYQDNFRATITSSSGSTSGYNPFGLGVGTSFSWWIQYDTNTIQGIVGFSSQEANNQVTFLVPTGSGTKNITKINDWSYPDSGPYGRFNDYFFNPATTRLTEFNYGGQTNYPPNFSTLGPSDYLLIMDATTSFLFFVNGADYTFFYFNNGLANFTPANDRSPVPIPGAILLLGSGLAAMTVLRRRRS
jgi:hypothetical protein